MRSLNRFTFSQPLYVLFQVAIVCDSETVSAHPFIGALVRYCEERGVEWRSALEYIDGDSAHAFSRGAGARTPRGQGKDKGKGSKGGKGAARACPLDPAELSPEQLAERAGIVKRLDELAASKEQTEVPRALDRFPPRRGCAGLLAGVVTVESRFTPYYCRKPLYALLLSSLSGCV